MNGVIVLSDGTLEIQNGNITNANNLDANNIIADYLQTQLLDISGSVLVEGNLTLKGNFTAGDISTDAHIINGKMTFQNVVPECSILPTTPTQLTNKSYCDTTFVFKSGSVAETITGVKTFSSRTLCSDLTIGASNEDLINVKYADIRYGQLAGTNGWTGTNSFSLSTTSIFVQNHLWTDGSGVAPDNTTKSRIMFDNVKNQTFAIQGWTFSGTAIATINGMGAEWNFGNPGGFNNYNSPLAPGSGNYWLNFNCRSPGTTLSNSTFYLEAPPTLQPGMYVVRWYSKFTAGGQFTTTSLNLGLGAGAFLLSYNDSDTRSTNVWRLRSITIEVKTAAKLRWTYRDTQATPNQYFSASVCNLQITQYPAVKVFDSINNTFVAGSLAQLNNVSMLGTNSITGTLSMVGIPSFLSSKGSNNVCISTQFTQAALATQASNNIVIGEMAFYAENFQKCILIGQNGLSNTANQQKTTTECIVLGGDTFGGCIRDIMIGVGNYKNYATTAEGGGDSILMGSYIGNNSTTIKSMSRSVAIGNYIWGAYPGLPFNGELIDNVAIGYATQQTAYGWFGSYSTAVGSQSMRYLRGNLSLASYNTALGYRSGVDPRAPTIETYQQGIYSYQTYLGAYARTNGDISGCQFGIALGYNTQSDASYCTVIGSDASYNVQNTIRLGRSQDKTVASSLWSIGTIDCSGSINMQPGGKIQSGNMYLYKSGTSITTTATITKPFYSAYSVEVVGTAYTITMPTINIEDLGQIVVFRKTKQTGTLVSISFIGDGLQKIYNNALVGGLTAQAIFTSSLYTIQLIALEDQTTGGGTFAWFML
jgi:hypothetical protein